MSCTVSGAEFAELVGMDAVAGDVGFDEVGAVSEEEMNGLNEAITTLTAEVNAAVDRTADSPKKVELRGFQLTRWTPFVMRWNAWFSSHATFPSRLFVDPEFAAFRAEYGQLREEWIGLGQSTNAPSASDAGASFRVPWGTILVVGAVVLGGYLLLAGAPMLIMGGHK